MMICSFAFSGYSVTAVNTLTCCADCWITSPVRPLVFLPPFCPIFSYNKVRKARNVKCVSWWPDSCKVLLLYLSASVAEQKLMKIDSSKMIENELHWLQNYEGGHNPGMFAGSSWDGRRCGRVMRATCTWIVSRALASLPFLLNVHLFRLRWIQRTSLLFLLDTWSWSRLCLRAREWTSAPTVCRWVPWSVSLERMPIFSPSSLGSFHHLFSLSLSSPAFWPLTPVSPLHPYLPLGFQLQLYISTSETRAWFGETTCRMSAMGFSLHWSCVRWGCACLVKRCISVTRSALISTTCIEMSVENFEVNVAHAQVLPSILFQEKTWFETCWVTSCSRLPNWSATLQPRTPSQKSPRSRHFQFDSRILTAATNGPALFKISLNLSALCAHTCGGYFRYYQKCETWSDV